ncbi:MAG TPA: nuclear transport factor 2 family protein, partial [Longimicrobiaceae bacterium]|nr:nuclear transport factor 2 family protein [Longimicrobiaceae bacterium]
MSLSKLLPVALVLGLASRPLGAQAVPLPDNNAPADRQRYRTEAMRDAMVVLGNWQSAWAQDNPRAVAGFYSPEASLVLPGQAATAQGNAELARALGAALPGMGRIEFQLIDASVGDDLLWLVQRYAVAAQNEASDLSTPPAYAGVSTTLFQRSPGGGWKIRSQVFGTGTAAAGAALLRQGATPAPPPRPTDAVLAGLSCSSFEWLPQEGIGEQGAIRIPVELNGQVYQFRLDTGSDGSEIYGDEATTRAWPKQGPSAVVVQRVKLGGVELGPSRVRTSPQVRPGATAGTVGLDLLMNHLVVIDYPGRHFCLVPRAAVPQELDGRVDWVAAEI